MTKIYIYIYVYIAYLCNNYSKIIKTDIVSSVVGLQYKLT